MFSYSNCEMTPWHVQPMYGQFDTFEVCNRKSSRMMSQKLSWGHMKSYIHCLNQCIHFELLLLRMILIKFSKLMFLPTPVRAWLWQALQICNLCKTQAQKSLGFQSWNTWTFLFDKELQIAKGIKILKKSWLILQTWTWMTVLDDIQ